MGNPVVHFEIIGKDTTRLRKFYTQAFNWHFDPPGAGVNAENYGLAKTQAGVGIDGGIGDMGAANGYSGHVTSCWGSRHQGRTQQGRDARWQARDGS